MLGCAVVQASDYEIVQLFFVTAVSLSPLKPAAIICFPCQHCCKPQV